MFKKRTLKKSHPFFQIQLNDLKTMIISKLNKCYKILQ